MGLRDADDNEGECLTIDVIVELRFVEHFLVLGLDSIDALRCIVDKELRGPTECLGVLEPYARVEQEDGILKNLTQLYSWMFCVPVLFTLYVEPCREPVIEEAEIDTPVTGDSFEAPYCANGRVECLLVLTSMCLAEYDLQRIHVLDFERLGVLTEVPVVETIAIFLVKEGREGVVEHEVLVDSEDAPTLNPQFHLASARSDTIITIVGRIDSVDVSESLGGLQVVHLQRESGCICNLRDDETQIKDLVIRD